MTTRERFLAVFRDHDPTVRALKWEFGWWGKTVNDWYKQGLPKNNWAPIPDKIVRTTSSTLNTAWNIDNKYVAPGEYPDGYIVCAGGLYWPSMGYALDRDVKNHFGMDETQYLVDLNTMFHPLFEPEIIENNEEHLVYVDIDGVTKKYLKEEGVLPVAMKFKMTNWEDWNQLKDERMRLDNIRDRLPPNWDQLVKEYKNRDYPLGIGGTPMGFFGTLGYIMGFENLFISYKLNPKLVHDILERFTEIWILTAEEVLKDVQLDFVTIWEDISFGKGSMISNKAIREFLLPYYKRYTGFLKAHGVDVVMMDTDGDCMDIIPLFMEGGVNTIFPFEAHAGMDVAKVREAFPDLAMLGGIDKYIFGKDKKTIDDALAHIEPVIKKGGYVPHIDHQVPPGVTFEEFSYYRNRLNDIIDSAGIR